MDTDNMIDFYDKGTWSRTDDLLPDNFDDMGSTLEKKCGFSSFHSLTTAEGFGHGIDIYQENKGQRYYIVLNTESSWHPVLVPDFPSLVMLVKELEPIISAFMECRKQQFIEELRDLLMGYRRTVGPLAECLSEKRLQEQQDHERRKANERKEEERKKKKADVAIAGNSRE